MIDNKSKNKWIEIGYELFGIDGPEGIQVERLARSIGFNKSGYYHYFGNREIYFNELLVFHSGKVDFFIEGISTLTCFEDYAQLLIDHRDTVLFHVQLSRNIDKKVYRDSLVNNNYRIEPLLLPHWAVYLQITDLGIAQKYFEMMRDMFYCRVNQKNLNQEYLLQLAKEVQILFKQIQNSRQ